MKINNIIKWTGGKIKELDIIDKYSPKGINNYYEPFVGGGSVWINAKAENYFINDKMDLLINLYRYIKTQDNEFFTYMNDIVSIWNSVSSWHDKKVKIFMDIYVSFRDDVIDKKEMQEKIKQFIQENENDSKELIFPFEKDNDIFIKEIQKDTIRKFNRMKSLEKDTPFSDDDINNNIKTCLLGAVYMYFRHLYNIRYGSQQMITMMFIFMRNYCFSNLFRYNDKGEFNVAYGGMSYNSKSLLPIIEKYMNKEIIDKMNKTAIYNQDFDDFLDRDFDEKDFIFLDPPYDTTFSKYGHNSFTKDDHIRLAQRLRKVSCRWMIIIKYTDFIYDLYKDYNIISYDNTYSQNIKNRFNENDVKHIIIRNYDDIS